jgi:hypothetical protein
VTVTAVSFSRHVTVDQTLSPRDAMEANGRTLFNLERWALNAMPRGKTKEEVFFFELNREVTNGELDLEYAARGLKPASPYSLAAIVDADPGFPDERRLGTYWQYKKDDYCSVVFYGKGKVSVYSPWESTSAWDACIRFAGVPR